MAKLHAAETLGDGRLLVSDQNIKGAAAAASFKKSLAGACKSLGNMSVQGSHVESHAGDFDAFLEQIENPILIT